MKSLFKTNCLFALLSILLFSCQNGQITVAEEVDNYFKEAALSNFNGGYHFYRSPFRSFHNHSVGEMSDNNNNIIAKQSDYCYKLLDYGSYGYRYYSYFGEKEIITDTELNDGGYYFWSNNEVYDYFGNRLTLQEMRINDEYEYVILLSSRSPLYEQIFHREEERNRLVIAYAIEFGEYYVFSEESDTAIHFDNAILKSQFIFPSSCVHFKLSIFNKYDYLIRRLDDYGVSYLDSIYYLDKNSKSDYSIKQFNKSDKLIPGKMIIDVNYPSFSYYYSLEKVDSIANDFDFYMDDFITAQIPIIYDGKPLDPGRYKIHSSHYGNYIPLNVFVSFNHDYAFCLCLEIDQNHNVLHNYGCIKISGNNEISNIDHNIDYYMSKLFGSECYVQFNNGFRSVKSWYLAYLDNNYFVRADNTKGMLVDVVINGECDDYYFGDAEFIAYCNGDLYFFNQGNITIFNPTSTDVFAATKPLDLDNLLYVFNGNTYFQDKKLDLEVDSIKEKRSFMFIANRKRYDHLLYATNNNQCFSLICME
ncbi:MAG: hypothetical protein IJ247_07165 [Bacilli bacterium]|nr:hypothetical protein [Bacilli bacterium]